MQVAPAEVGEVVLDVAVLKGGLLDILVEVADPEGCVGRLLAMVYSSATTRAQDVVEDVL